MRILLVVDRLYRGGGTETHILTLAKELRRRGHQVVLYTSGGPWVSRALNDRTRVVVHKTMRQLSHKDIVTFAGFVKRRTFDVIHAHEPLGFTLTNRAQHYLGVRLPLIFTLHGPYIEGQTLRRIGKSTRKVISVSTPMRKLAIRTGRISPTKVITIPNGIDTHAFTSVQKNRARTGLGVALDPFTIGYAGRFTHDKVQLGMRVVRALTRFARRHRHVQVLVAGRGSKQYVNTSSNVSVLGHVDDMARFLSACDVVVGTGRVAAEALVCGKPTIVIGTTGYYGLITSKNVKTMTDYNFGDHGARYRDWTADRLVKEMTQVKGNIKDTRREMNKLRSAILKKLSAARMVDQVLKVYQVMSPPK